MLRKHFDQVESHIEKFLEQEGNIADIKNKLEQLEQR